MMTHRRARRCVKPGAGRNCFRTPRVGVEFSMDQETAGRAKAILVVDGNSQRLTLIENILRDDGYCVLSATSAEQAEALADTESVFDLIICSVIMEPRGDTGVQLAEHIERSKRINSTLLISHYSRDLLHHVPGFDRQRHFLSNPFTAEELLHRVRDLLTRPPDKRAAAS